MSGQEQKAPTFDSIIQRDRQKIKNESLAAKVFGRSTTPSSLSERHGVSKSRAPKLAHRTSSSSSITRASQNKANIKAPRNRSNVSNANAGNNSNQNQELSIKGMGSGSCIVVCQNFAPGTSAADIEAVMAPDPYQGCISCRVICASPTVIAELVFAGRDEANQVVQLFNNRTADGRLLHCYIQNPKGGNTQATQRSNNNKPPRNGGYSREPANPYTEESMDVDNDYPREPKRADPVIQDGSYGFNDDSTANYQSRQQRRGRGGRGGNSNRNQNQNRDQRPQGGRLVSDSMIGR